MSGTDLDDLYAHLADERDLSLALVNRCHSQPRVMFNRALRKKLVDHNPALSADPVKLKEVDLAIPSMTDVRAVQAIGPGCLCRPPPGSRHRRRSQGKHGGTTSQARRRAEPATPVHARDRRGSGRSGREGHEGRPTVRRHPRQGTCAVLGEHLARVTDRARTVGVEFDGETFVFSDDGGRSHWNLSWPSHAWRRYSSKAGVRGFHLHHLRRTAASEMLMADVPFRSSRSDSAAPRRTS